MSSLTKRPPHDAAADDGILLGSAIFTAQLGAVFPGFLPSLLLLLPFVLPLLLVPLVAAVLAAPPLLVWWIARRAFRGPGSA
jgi:hypothetical protein